jgi:hypothetical protein
VIDVQHQARQRRAARLCEDEFRSEEIQAVAPVRQLRQRVRQRSASPHTAIAPLNRLKESSVFHALFGKVCAKRIQRPGIGICLVTAEEYDRKTGIGRRLGPGAPLDSSRNLEMISKIVEKKNFQCSLFTVVCLATARMKPVYGPSVEIIG